MTEPCDLDALTARRLIGSRALSPVELLESCIARIESVDHAVNAVVARDFARARLAARTAERTAMRGERLGPLHGLPIGIKDLEETEGLRTTWGSPLYRDHVPASDLRSVAAIREAGGIVIGKTNVPEWGAGANTRNAVYGATGNPFDPARSAAGSSGGSAVALACGMVPLATGSDTGGSLRNPAAFCGVVGFRPSPGLVPNPARGHGWSCLSVLGPMARTVPDAALLLSAMADDDGVDALAGTVHGRRMRSGAEFFPLAEIDLAALRVAFTPDLGFAPVERRVAALFAARTATFRAAFAADADEAPDCAGADEAFEVLRAVGFLGAHLHRYRETPDLLGPNVRANVEEGLRYTAEDVARAMNLQTQMYQRWQGFFARHDLVIAPAASIAPRPWRELYPATIDGAPTRTYFHWLALVYAASLVGHPALVIPAGTDADGLPFCLQLIGPRGGDAMVLQAGAALERLLAAAPETARPLPDLAALAAAPPISEAEDFLGFG